MSKPMYIPTETLTAPVSRAACAMEAPSRGEVQAEEGGFVICLEVGRSSDC